MTTTRTATRLIPAPANTIRDLLQQAGRLPDWNPAFLRLSAPEPATIGHRYPLRVRPGLEGTFEYTALSENLVVMQWQVPGLLEHAEWRLAPHADGTVATNEVRRTGPLAHLLNNADRDIAELRLARLEHEVNAATAPAPRSSNLSSSSRRGW